MNFNYILFSFKFFMVKSNIRKSFFLVFFSFLNTLWKPNIVLIYIGMPLIQYIKQCFHFCIYMIINFIFGPTQKCKMYKFKNISIIYDILRSILYTNKLIRQIHGLIVLIVMNKQQIIYIYIYIYINFNYFYYSKHNYFNFILIYFV